MIFCNRRVIFVTKIEISSVRINKVDKEKELKFEFEFDLLTIKNILKQLEKKNIWLLVEVSLHIAY